MIKIKSLLDNKILIAWNEFERETNVGGIIIQGYQARNVGENRGTIKMVGPNVKHVKIEDYIMYAVGTIYQPFETNHGKEIIIPESDVIMVLKNE